MKPSFLFYFEHEPERVAVDSRQRTARMLRAYRKKPHEYTITRTAPNSYKVAIKGFFSPIIIHSQENIAWPKTPNFIYQAVIKDGQLFAKVRHYATTRRRQKKP